MKTSLTQPLYAILIGSFLIASATSCKKRRAEKELYGTYSRDLPSETYTDSTTQLLLLNESFIFSNGGDVGEIRTTGTFAASVFYSIEKSDDENYDLELKLQNLDYSDWLPKNYVNGTGGVTYNSVVPNTQVLDQVRFYVKTDEDYVRFMMRYPEGDVVQEYERD